MSIPTAEDLFWYVAQNVVGRLKFVDCVIYRANPQQTELVQVAALGNKNPFGRNILNPLRIPFGQGITGRVAQTRKAIVVDDLATDLTYIPDTQPARSEICVPLVSQGKIVGVLDSEHPDPCAFGEAELEILTTIAAMTSAKLELLAEADRSRQRYADLVHSHAQLNEEVNNRKALETALFEARKLEAIGRLSGRFAHEFNNLLTVISGNLDFLAMSVSEPDSLTCLTDAQVAAKRGAALIHDMLAFSQRAHSRPQVSDLNKLALAASERSKQDLTENIALEVNLSAELSLVSVDPTAAESTVFNLIKNAREALPNGGKLKITTKNVWHDLSEDRPLSAQRVPGRYVCLSVEDNGKGIPAECLDQIFDPFFTTKAVGTGIGMGLSSVLGFMKQMGGTVEVTSKLDQGSAFHLFFPAVADRVNDLVTTRG